jgi:hypothetical protein
MSFIAVEFCYTGKLQFSGAMKKTIIAALLAAISIPSLAGEFYVVVPVQNRTATNANILVTLNPATLPGAVAGRAYAGYDFGSVLQVKGDPNFVANGVTWRIASGALPAGLALSADGNLSGMPTAAGTSRFQLMASYKTKSGQQNYQVVVGEVTVALASAALPAGEQGAAYSYDFKGRLSAAGDPDFNIGAVAWSVQGAMPPGLVLNADGTVTGVPTAEGTYPFTVTARYLSSAGQQDYQVSVAAITIALAGANTAPPHAVVGQAYGAGSGWDLKPNLTISGDAAYSSAQGVTWSVTSGALPAGLVLGASTGVVSGTPTAAGINPVQVRAQYKGKVATQNYTVAMAQLLAQFSGYRAWANGTLAASCEAYRHPATGYAYAGATGSGTYRIQHAGVQTNVYCDMTTAGGGWTLIARSAPGAASTTFGYKFKIGAIGDDTVPYSLGDVAALKPTQVLFGNYDGALTWGSHVYTNTLPAGLFTSYESSGVYAGRPTPVSGGVTTFGMADFMGYSGRGNGFYFRDNEHDYFYGLGPAGWDTAYQDDAPQAPAGWNGFLYGRQGWIFVR